MARPRETPKESIKMIKILTACTREVDDVKTAVAEILEQLDLANRLRKNAVGIFSFHHEFLNSGLLEAFASVLPFQSVGFTTPRAAIRGASGDVIFSVAVLTSDAIEFSAGLSAPVVQSPDEAVCELYSRIVPSGRGKPSLLLAFAPLMPNVDGDRFVAAIDAASGGVPVFGAMAFSDHSRFSGAEIYANGEHGADVLALVALFGEVGPRFYLSDYPGEKEIRKRAIVTRSERNLIQRIDNSSPLDFLESIGLAEEGRLATGIASFPFVLTLEDGTRVVRVAQNWTTDEGYLVLGGGAPEGAEIGFSGASADFVIRSAKNTIAQVLADASAENALIISCTSRKWTLGAVPGKEAQTIAKASGDALFYLLAYSGGEICPVKNKEGQWVNRFHNFTMATCLF
jgi:hypothetical protein